jgi:uncharacterized membrane protein (UPF0182 family)
LYVSPLYLRAQSGQVPELKRVIAAYGDRVVMEETLPAALAALFKEAPVAGTPAIAAPFCVEALEEALARYGRPEIFNTDQGSQFTGAAFTSVLINAGVLISWTAAAAGWTTSSSNASGARSSTRRFI